MSDAGRPKKHSDLDTHLLGACADGLSSLSLGHSTRSSSYFPSWLLFSLYLSHAARTGAGRFFVPLSLPPVRDVSCMSYTRDDDGGGGTPERVAPLAYIDVL